LNGCETRSLPSMEEHKLIRRVTNRAQGVTLSLDWKTAGSDEKPLIFLLLPKIFKSCFNSANLLHDTCTFSIHRIHGNNSTKLWTVIPRVVSGHINSPHRHTQGTKLVKDLRMVTWQTLQRIQDLWHQLVTYIRAFLLLFKSYCRQWGNALMLHSWSLKFTVSGNNLKLEFIWLHSFQV